MKTITLKSLLLYLVLINTAFNLKAITPQKLSQEQIRGAALITKLYSPIKLKLIALSANIAAVEQKITSAVNLFASNPNEPKEQLKKSLTKKLKKLATLREKLVLIQYALQRCPLSLKTEQAQQAINQAGLIFLGSNLTPSNLENRIKQALDSTKQLLEMLG